MDENEEFEFRHRREQEQAAPNPGIMGAVGSALAGRPELHPYGGITKPEGFNAGVGGALQAAGATLGAPIRAGQTLMQAPDVAGEAAADVGGELGYPKTGAAIGTGLQMLPNILAAGGAAGAAGEFAGPQLARIARNQTMKSLGGSMRQIRGLAAAGGLDEAAQYARNKGLADVFSTSLGREKLAENLGKTTGEGLGTLRQAAGPAESGILDQVAAQIGAKYNPANKDLLSKQAGQVGKSVGMIKNAAGGPEPTHAGIAKGITALNQYATGEKLRQPVGAMTDVAHAASAANDAAIAAKLGPEKAAQYEKLLDEYSHLKPIQHLQNYGELREMAPGRPGLINALKSVVPTGMGNRAVAKGAGVLVPTAQALGGAAPLAGASAAPAAQTLEEYLRRQREQP